jgi:hypothetical protein
VDRERYTEASYLNTSPSIFRTTIEENVMSGHLALTGAIKNTCRVLVGMPSRKRLFGSPGVDGDNIKMHLKNSLGE